MTVDQPGSIAAIARLCATEAALDHHWARVLGRAARVSGPGERQRVLLASSHRHARLATEWEARLPITDDTESMLASVEPHPLEADLETYRQSLSERASRLEGLLESLDGLCDPSTVRLLAEAARLTAELSDEVGRIGV